MPFSSKDGQKFYEDHSQVHCQTGACDSCSPQSATKPTKAYRLQRATLQITLHAHAAATRSGATDEGEARQK